MKYIHNNCVRILCWSTFFHATWRVEWGLQIWRPGPDPLIALCTGLLGLQERVTQMGKGFVSHSPSVCVTVSTISVPHLTVIVTLVLSLGLTDGQGDCVPGVGARELVRDP